MNCILSPLLIHASACLLLLLLTIVKLLPIPYAAYPMMVLVPLFGPLALLLFGIHLRRKSAEASVDISRFQLENEIYRSMGMDTVRSDIVPLEEAIFLNPADTRRNLMLDMMKESVVPLEEALTISNSQVRRKLMLDVLNSDTAKYYALLEQARLNDDVEVVHYAVTAMSELNKKYDLMIAEFTKALDADPEDVEILGRYCSCLKQYLALGLADGAILDLRQRACIAAYQKLCEKQPLERYFCDLARQQMLANNFAAAEQTLQTLDTQFPDSEDIRLLRLEYFARRGDGETVQRMAFSVWTGEMYLSQKAKETLAFWLNKGSCYEKSKA